MKTEVTFTISNPVAFEAKENYEHLGITTQIKEDKLIGLKTVVEHDSAAGHSDIVSEARVHLTPLLTLIEYSCGLPAHLDGVQTHAIEPDSAVSIGLDFVKVAATLFRKVPMPPAGIVENLTEGTRLQLSWYTLGQKSDSVFERIKYFYMVLEQEAKSAAKIGLPYTVPPEAKHLRDAVSHPEIGNAEIIQYLQKEIGSSKIDPANDAHVQFLAKKLPVVQLEAQKVLSGKVPRWW